MVQKTNIDALHKEGKSQRVITERCGLFLQSAVSKHINAKLTGRKNLGRIERCTSNRDDRELENTVKQRLIQTLGRASQGVD